MKFNVHKHKPVSFIVCFKFSFLQILNIWMCHMCNIFEHKAGTTWGRVNDRNYGIDIFEQGNIQAYFQHFQALATKDFQKRESYDYKCTFIKMYSL